MLRSPGWMRYAAMSHAPNGYGIGSMPKAFNDCRKSGGKIRTIKPKPDRTMRVCIRPKGQKGKGGGRTVSGHTRKT